MNATTNIAFFGSSLVSAYWNGAATYYRGIIRALNNLGYRITFYEPDAYDRQHHRDIEDPDWANVFVYTASDESGVFKALEQASTADIIVKASGVGVYDELLEAAVVESDSLKIFWDVDAPATLDRVKNNINDQFRDLVPKYDLILTYGGGPAVVSAYKELGAVNCVPIYNALDLSTHYRVEKDSRYECDLALLANRLPDREARVEEFFLSVADALPEKRFVLGGSGWEDKAVPPNVTYVGHVYTKDHNAFNSTPLAVLNVNRESMAAYGFSPPTRIFEAAGAAACVITDEWIGIDSFLKRDEEVLVAKNGEDVVRHLLDLTTERALAIGEAARSRMLAQHTYDHRAEQLSSVLDQFTRLQRSIRPMTIPSNAVAQGGY
jgi:spore maturation protein CgeB